MSELLHVDAAIWLLAEQTGIPNYDFDFTRFFPCRQPQFDRGEVVAICRCGAFEDYQAAFATSLDEGIRYVNDPSAHRRASELSEWYPLLEDLTPRSRIYERAPTGSDVANEFRFPVFVKGARQTSRHRRALSIVASEDDFDSVMESYASDPILSWQSIVVRELVPLRSVEDVIPDRIPSSFEFRTFWLDGAPIGAGRYWWEGRSYDWSPSERREGLAIAAEAARRVAAPFVAVDVAMTANGRWIVIECNDGQESGYAGVSPIGLWQTAIDLRRNES